MTHFTEPALQWLAGTDVDKVAAHDTFRGASITVEGRHGYGRGCGPLHSSQSQHCCCGLARLWARSGQITYFTVPPLLWLAGTIIAEVGCP